MRQFIIPYLSFKNSLETANYYQEIFDGKIVYMMLGKDMPDYKPEEENMVMHLELDIQGNMIYMGDNDKIPNDRIMLHLNYNDLSLATKHYQKMAKEATVIRKLEKAFWGATYGILEDKYKIKWQFHVSIPKQ